MHAGFALARAFPAGRHRWVEFLRVHWEAILADGSDKPRFEKVPGPVLSRGAGEADRQAGNPKPPPLKVSEAAQVAFVIACSLLGSVLVFWLHHTHFR